MPVDKRGRVDQREDMKAPAADHPTPSACAGATDPCRFKARDIGRRVATGLNRPRNTATIRFLLKRIVTPVPSPAKNGMMSYVMVPIAARRALAR